MAMLLKNRKKGFSLLELVLAVAVFSMFAISVGSLLVDSVSATDANHKKIEAIFLAREGIEAARSIRNTQGFVALTPGTYGVALVVDEWEWSGTSDITDDTYTRTVQVVAGVEDDTVEVISTVSAPSVGRTISVLFRSILTDWRQ